MFLCFWVVHLENKPGFPSFPCTQDFNSSVGNKFMCIARYQRTPFLFNKLSASDFPKDCFSLIIPLVSIPFALALICLTLGQEGYPRENMLSREKNSFPLQVTHFPVVAL